MDTYQQYVQSVSDSDSSGTTRRVLLGGDQLTVERARSAQAVRSQSETSLLRLEGLHPKVEDWHALVNFYQVCCIVLFAASVIVHCMLLNIFSAPDYLEPPLQAYLQC